MMKRLKYLFLFVVIAYSIFLVFIRHESYSLSPMAFENIEALAEGEVGGTYFCYGTGDVQCPNGQYVKYVVDDYSLR